MSPAVERLKSESAALTTSERAELAQFLIDSLDEATDPDAEATWDVESARRVDQIRGGEVEGRPADEVFAALHAKYSWSSHVLLRSLL